MSTDATEDAPRRLGSAGLLPHPAAHARGEAVGLGRFGNGVVPQQAHLALTLLGVSPDACGVAA